ncbi:unnamed protein product [Lymnaea stagnalis]|uniref:Uncharacterized protein n=1 Tax=Lymnaea stagnalis TaxID=6523 RepID=A0AAV2HD42_LYMST
MAQFQSYSDQNMLKIPVDRIPAQVMQGLKDAIHTFSNSIPDHPSGASPKSTKTLSPTTSSYQTLFSQVQRTPFSQPTCVAQTNDLKYTTTWSSYQNAQGFRQAAGPPGHAMLHKACFDEVDGATKDSVVHAVQVKKPSVKVIDAYDDSDIVRIFDTNQDKQQTLSRSDSEIIRIFESGPSGEKRLADDSDIPRICQTDSSPEKRRNTDPNVVHVHPRFSLSDQELGNDPEHLRSTHAGPKPCASPMMEVTKMSSSTGQISSLQQDNPIIMRQMYDESFSYSDTQSPITKSRSSPSFYADKIIPVNCSTNKSPNQILYKQSLYGSHESNSTTMAPQTGRPRLSHTMPLTSLGSSEPLTPPQTPLDEELDDDEVFSNEDVVTRRDAYHNPLEITPRRDVSTLRHNSDRSVELLCPSPFSPCQKLAEINFGDRQNTKKRLSFDEDKQQPHQQHHRSMMPQPKFPAPTGQSSYNCTSGPFQSNLSRPPDVNHHCSPYKCRATNQQVSYHKRVSSCPSASSTSTAGDSQHNYLINNQSHQVTQAQPNSCRSPVSEVMKMLELVSSNHSPSSSSVLQRSRIHSDGDNISDCTGQAQWRPRGQTFSNGKRRRMNSSVGCEGDEEIPCDQVMLTPSREPSDDSCEDCHCAIIEKCVLQMAENAYKRIKKLDATPEDFERFRKELATTNDLLRQSLVNISSIRNICHHRSRSSSSSSSSSLPTTRPS